MTWRVVQDDGVGTLVMTWRGVQDDGVGGARDLRAVGIEVDSKKGSQIDCKPVFVEHRRFENKL